jgi:hypothetical protein
VTTAEDRIIEFEAARRTANEQAERWNESARKYDARKRRSKRSGGRTLACQGGVAVEPRERG